MDDAVAVALIFGTVFGSAVVVLVWLLTAAGIGGEGGVGGKPLAFVLHIVFC